MDANGPSWLGTLDGPCYHRQRTFLPHTSFPLPLQRATLIQSLLPAELPELECEDEKKRQQSGINCQREKANLGLEPRASDDERPISFAPPSSGISSHRSSGVFRRLSKVAEHPILVMFPIGNLAYFLLEGPCKLLWCARCRKLADEGRRLKFRAGHERVTQIPNLQERN